MTVIWARVLLFVSLLVSCLGNLEFSTEKSTVLHLTFPGPETASYSMMNVPQTEEFVDSSGNDVVSGATLPSKDVFVTPNGEDGIVSFVWKLNDGTTDVYSTASISKYTQIVTNSRSVTSSGPTTILLNAEHSWGVPVFSILSLPTAGSLHDGNFEITVVPHELSSDIVVFSPPAGWGCATTTFQYQALSSLAGSSPSDPSTITVVGTVPPTANQLTFSIPTSSSLDISFVQELNQGCSEIESFFVTSLPTGGTLEDGGIAITHVPHLLSGSTVTYVSNSDSGVSVFAYKAVDATLSAENSVVVEKYFAASATSDVVIVPHTGAQVSLTATNTAGNVQFALQSVEPALTLYRCLEQGPCSSRSLGDEILPESLPVQLDRNRVFVQPSSASIGSATFTFSVSDSRASAPTSGVITVFVPPESAS